VLHSACMVLRFDLLCHHCDRGLLRRTDNEGRSFVIMISFPFLIDGKGVTA